MKERSEKVSCRQQPLSGLMLLYSDDAVSEYCHLSLATVTGDPGEYDHGVVYGYPCHCTNNPAVGTVCSTTPYTSCQYIAFALPPTVSRQLPRQVSQPLETALLARDLASLFTLFTVVLAFHLRTNIGISTRPSKQLWDSCALAFEYC